MMDLNSDERQSFKMLYFNTKWFIFITVICWSDNINTAQEFERFVGNVPPRIQITERASCFCKLTHSTEGHNLAHSFQSMEVFFCASFPQQFSGTVKHTDMVKGTTEASSLPHTWQREGVLEWRQKIKILGHYNKLISTTLTGSGLLVPDGLIWEFQKLLIFWVLRFLLISLMNKMF